ncbi:cation diffusion facilitator family transporter [Chitinispirillales bacterium ANBcel5]|uniref:cation diffusion facilitator family transporter n=1 Tax=Cellulosispirillum alkaliphilum TaxID=3039283 RepID=UPI002A4F6D8F|nr:cation diffusion facilitator family transporter [Chitinispirillales bacterium ANBcel5]
MEMDEEKKVPKSIKEEKYLKASSYGALSFALIAFFLGVLLRSQVIIFDGLYSVISVLLSFFSLFAFRYMKKSDWRRFPFGKDTIEPLVVLTKYIALIALLIGSLIAAIVAIFQGGREIDVGAGLLYAIFAFLFCLMMYMILIRTNKKLKSNLIRTEAAEWYLDSIVSLGVLIGFLIAYGFTFVPALAPYQPYIDPVMMIVLGVYFVEWPIKEIRKALRSLLDMRPTDESSAYVDRVINDIQNAWRFQESFTRVTKPRQNLWLEVDFIVGKKNIDLSIREQDSIRKEIIAKINEKYEGDHWVTVVFTNERKFAI